jgi:hypothetical protein
MVLCSEVLYQTGNYGLSLQSAFLRIHDFVNGGWWQNLGILMATGNWAKAEAVGCQGLWNEWIVQSVMGSMEKEDVLTVLLTGRGERRFADIIKKMVTAKKLDFDLICLKPERFLDTAAFKLEFMEDLLHTYKQAENICVYEDRVKQYVLKLTTLFIL